MEASVGSSGAEPPPAASGCPFWSSPSPVPAPQAPSISTIAANPQRKEARAAKRALLDRYLPANLAAGAARCPIGTADAIRAVDVEVGIARAEIRHILLRQCRPGGSNRDGINIRSLRQGVHHVWRPTDSGRAGVDMRYGCIGNVVRHVADEDFIWRRRIEHDGSPPGSRGRVRRSFLGAV